MRVSDPEVPLAGARTTTWVFEVLDPKPRGDAPSPEFPFLVDDVQALFGFLASCGDSTL